ncbi:MAG TPA: M15 family metallopeptidase [Terriglobales bacterium]|jgi:hypothetical protein|nr:M15 family metallopeptidase [Terriglobales bacterium]
MSATAVVKALVVPNGLDEIIATFGNIFAHLRADGTPNQKWEPKILTVVAIPFPMRLSFQDTSVRRVRCHKKLAPIVRDLFQQIQGRGLAEKIKTYGGCYQFRRKSSGGDLSVHSWGIAFDLNPGTNKMGTTGDMDNALVSIFEEFGFEWGGRWTKTKDPMHFQYCTGF